jgi:hypothetical protein
VVQLWQHTGAQPEPEAEAADAPGPVSRARLRWKQLASERTSLASVQRIREFEDVMTLGTRTDAAEGMPLLLYIERAEGLLAADTWGKSDPFCRVVLDGTVVGETQTIEQTLEPAWDAYVHLPAASGPARELTVEVWGRGSGTKFAHFLGEVVLAGSLVRARALGALQPKPSKSDKFNRCVRGAVSFAIQPDRIVAIHEVVHKTLVRQGHGRESEQVHRISPSQFLQVFEQRGSRVRTDFGWASTLSTEGSELLRKTDAAVETQSWKNGDCRGWLEIKASARGAWVCAWAELAAGTLTYFESNSGGEGLRQKGSLQLQLCYDVRTAGDDRGVLELACVAQTYRLRCRAAAELTVWRAALSQAAQAQHTPGQHTDDDDEESDEDELAISSWLEVGSAGQALARNFFDLSDGCLSYSKSQDRPGKAAPGPARSAQPKVYLYDIDPPSIKRGFGNDCGPLSTVPGREFRFTASVAGRPKHLLLRASTTKLASRWVEALAAAFHPTTYAAIHEGKLFMLSPERVWALAVLTAEGTLQLTTSGHRGHTVRLALDIQRCRRVRRTLDAPELSTDPSRELQLEYQPTATERKDGLCSGPYRFRAANREQQEEWCAGLPARPPRLGLRPSGGGGRGEGRGLQTRAQSRVPRS